MSKRIKLSPSNNNTKQTSEFWVKFLQVNPQFYDKSKRLDRIKANKFNNGKREKPYHRLEKALEQNPPSDPTKDEKVLVHWFRNDLRVHDNLALLNTIDLGHKLNKKVVTVYVFNEFDLRRHLDSAFKINFVQRTLAELKQSLNALNIPLKVIYTDQRDFTPYFVEDLISKKFLSKTVSFNLRYEWDELNTDISIIESSNLNVFAVHEQCIVEPFHLKTGKGTVYSKFTPWWKNWAVKTLQMCKNGELECLADPKPFKQWDYEELNDQEGKLEEEFGLKQLVESSYYKGIVTMSDLANVKEQYKAGEKAAYETFDTYIDQGVYKYISDKDPPHKSGSSHLSHHLAQGAISVRYIFSKLIALNNDKTIGGNKSIETFIKELAWREFFRHLVCNWPYTMMYVPTNLSSLDLQCENSEEKFIKWCLGETGFPIVDASMKELLRTGYMNNRCRMVCSSFLAKDLNIDYRAGELWFYHHLIDGDLISNNQGWQWATSTGIDSQPWFRIFNVYLQSEKFDKDCKFIKQWLPELKKYPAKQVHYAESLKDYHKPCIDRDAERETTLERYREVMSMK